MHISVETEKQLAKVNYKNLGMEWYILNLIKTINIKVTYHQHHT